MGNIGVISKTPLTEGDVKAAMRQGYVAVLAPPRLPDGMPTLEFGPQLRLNPEISDEPIEEIVDTLLDNNPTLRFVRIDQASDLALGHITPPD